MAATSAAWVEKYRPNSLEDIKSHKDIISTLKNFMTQDEIPDLLLYGPPGTGKTSTILCCCKEMYGASYQTMVIHLNASDERGIEVVRQRIRDFSRARTFLQLGKYKLVVLDEADAMTEEAQSALRQVIFQSRHNTRYCLICNYVTKIIPSLRSRFVILRYSPLEQDELSKMLTDIAKIEKLTLTSSAIEAIIHISDGDARKAINLLQSCSYQMKRCRDDSEIGTKIKKIKGVKKASKDHIKIEKLESEEDYNQVDENDIFKVSSKPNPLFFHQQIYNLLHLPLIQSIQKLDQWILETGISLLDFVQLLSTQIVKYKLPNLLLETLIPKLAEIEHHLCFTHTKSIQLQAIASVFNQARQLDTILDK